MKNALLLALLFILFSCNGTEHQKVDYGPIEQFDSFILSIEPGWSSDDSKDVEILKDGTTYLRLRDNREIKENYKGKIDSQSLRQIFLLVDSMNVESMDTIYQDYLDGPAYSLVLRNAKGEMRAKGMDFPFKAQKLFRRVIEIVEEQQLVKTVNKSFETTKDVLWPLPPGNEESQAVLDSL